MDHLRDSKTISRKEWGLVIPSLPSSPPSHVSGALRSTFTVSGASASPSSLTDDTSRPTSTYTISPLETYLTELHARPQQWVRQKNITHTRYTA